MTDLSESETVMLVFVYVKSNAYEEKKGIIQPISGLN